MANTKYTLEELIYQRSIFAERLASLRQLFKEGEQTAQKAYLQAMATKTEVMISESAQIQLIEHGIQVTSLTVGKTYRVQQDGHRLDGQTVVLRTMKFSEETGKLVKLFGLVGLHSVEELPVGSLVEIEP